MPRPAARVDAVDLARGLALSGMMFVHLGPRWIDTNPPWGQMIASGRSAPLFAMLAGVALSLVHRRDPRGAGSVRATCIRGLILIALWLGSLEHMPVYVILAFYGLMIVVALPFRGLSARWLLLLGLGWAVVVPVGLLWLQIVHGPVVSDQAELRDLLPPWHLLTELVVWGAYPAGVWFAYVLVGLAIGRLDLGSPRTAIGVLAGGTVLLPLRSAGAMTLTLYTIHVLWTWRITLAGLDDPVPSDGSVADWLLQVVVLLAVATMWQRFVGRGPLESLVRLASVWGRAVPERANAPA